MKTSYFSRKLFKEDSINKGFSKVLFTLSFLIVISNLNAQEACDNGIDDDNDGLIDLNDSDCDCEIISLESIIPNPSFEDYSCCPDDHSQVDCAEAWIQPSIGSSDYIHHCGYNYDFVENSALNQFPDGDGAMGFLAGVDPTGDSHIEYIGACLNSPLLQGNTYLLKLHIGFMTENLSPPFTLGIYGAASCQDLPFTTTQANCPLSYPNWVLISQEAIDNNGVAIGWLEFTIEIQPLIDINAIVIGPDCQHGSLENGIGYLVDNLILNEKEDFDFEIIDEKHPCDPDFTFAVAEKFINSYQWYKEGIALVGETNAELSQMYGEGNYQLRIINVATQACRVSYEFEYTIPVIENEVFETLCQGEELMYNGDVIDKEGSYEYSLISLHGCDSIVTLMVEEHEVKSDTLFIKTLPDVPYSIGNAQYSKEGEYVVNLETTDGCDSIVILNLEHIKIYIPNAFSPNGDRMNDYFEVYTSDNDLVVSEMSIYDRWGNLVHEGNKWDGRYKNKELNPGMYVYVVRVQDANGEELVFSNTITLLR